MSAIHIKGKKMKVLLFVITLLSLGINIYLYLSREETFNKSTELEIVNNLQVNYIEEISKKCGMTMKDYDSYVKHMREGL
jgi:hypothetical protein